MIARLRTTLKSMAERQFPIGSRVRACRVSYGQKGLRLRDIGIIGEVVGHTRTGWLSVQWAGDRRGPMNVERGQVERLD